MQFRILGPLEVIGDGGRSLVLGGNRERALLGLLLLSPNRVVPWERLIDELWGERPPEGASHALRVYVSRLRKALREAEGDGVLVTRTPGYLVRVEPGALDAARFEALVGQGRAETANGDHTSAAETFRAALALWRGSVLADLPDAPRVRTETARLEEIRLAALEGRIEADLACGRHGELVAELDGLTRAHPLRERLWAQRMLALYRTGRQAEALRAYQELRRVLGQELGLEPSPAVVHLERGILDHEPGLDWAPSETPPPDPRQEVVGQAAGASNVRAERQRGPGPPSRSPSLAGVVERTPYVGRKREREELRALLERAARGAGGVVMIGGEPGVGKTRLTEQLAADAVERHLQALVGHCYETEGSPPYIAFVEILELALAHAPDPELFRRILGDEAAEMTRLLPNLRRLYADIPAPLEYPAGQERHLLFNSVRDVVARLAGHRPALLVLDDLHWADEPSLLLLEHLAARLAEMPILVLATYRDTEVDVDRPLARTFEHLRRHRLARWMTLGRLSEEEVAGMLRAMSGDEAPPALVRALYGTTEGNPFFLEEVYRHLAEEGRLFDADGRRFRTEPQTGDLDVPPGVRLVVGRRLSRLGTDARRLLAAAAVAGRSCSVELLEDMEDIDLDTLLDVLDDIRGAGLVVPSAGPSGGEDRFVFAHELIRQTVLSDLSMTRRRRLHTRAAAAIERRYAANLGRHAADIAHHLLEAGPAGDADRILQHLVAAGNWAMDCAAFEDAMHHYERALALDDAVESPGRADLLFQLAMARRSAGHWDAAIDALQQSLAISEERGDEEAIGRVALAATYMLVWAARWEEAVQVGQRGAAVLGEPLDRGRLLAMVAVPTALGGHYEKAAQLIEEALAVQARLEDSVLLGHILLGKAVTHLVYLEHSDTVDDGRRAAELLRNTGDLWSVTSALGFVLNVLPYAGRLDEARQLIDELKPLAERLGNHGALEQIRRMSAMIEFFVSPDLDRLEAFAHHDGEESRNSGMPWISHSWTWQGMARFLRGDWAEARPLFEEAVRLEIPSVLAGWDAALLFECLAYLGERSAALALLDERDLPQPGRPKPWGGTNMLVSAVEGLVVLGERSRAFELYPWVVDCLQRTGVISPSYIDGRLIERAAGIAAMAGGRGQEAEAHFERALAQARSIPHRLEEAHTRRFYGQMLLERDRPGDRARSKELLVDAIKAYGDLGMPRHLEMAEAFLARCRPPRDG